MDFKVAGTREFVTAIQLDTKLDGIPASVLAGALTQARDARLHILDVMTEAIDAPDEMSPFAPRVIAVQVPVDKIGEVIGPKGKMINQIQDETGAQISIEDDGTVYIGATDGPSAEAARAMINAIANPQMPEIGERFLGTVVKTTTFGAFISLLPGQGRPAAHLRGAQARRWQARSRTSRTSWPSARRSRSSSRRSTRAASCRCAAVLDEGGPRDARLRPRPRRPSRGRRPDDAAGPPAGVRPGVSRGRAARPSGRTATPSCVVPSCPAGSGCSRSTCRACARRPWARWVGVGSRDESDGHHGSTHFLEHLLFKGTARRTAMDIAEGVRRRRW